MFNKLRALSLGKKIVLSLAGILAVGTIANASSNSTTQPLPITNPTAAKPTELPKVKSDTVEVREVTENSTENFTSSIENTNSINAGAKKIKTIGVPGVRTKVWAVTYTNGVESSRVLKSDLVTKQPVTEVVLVGTYVAPKYVAPPTTNTNTSNCDPNYSPCIPNTSGNALNCSDIRMRVTVIGVDHNKFDSDGDGIGCENY